ncbi:MAG: MFS transporter [Pseudomonadota bacterium]
MSKKPDPGTDYAAIAVVYGLICLFAVAQGFCYPLFSLLMEKQNVSSSLIGLNSAMTPLGLLLSAPLIPRWAQVLGAGRLALFSVLALAFLIAAAGIWQSLWLWFPVRFLLGVAINGLYITSETWINQLAGTRNRGKILGLFSASLSIGFALGPLIIAVVGSAGWMPFATVIAIVLMSVPVLLATMSRLPEFEVTESHSVIDFIPSAKFLMFIVAAAAVFDQVTLVLLPVYGLSMGLSEAVMATAIGIMVLGNIFLQFAIGWCADFWSRRGMLVTLCLLVMIGCLLLPSATAHNWYLWTLIFFWGAAGYGTYTIALVELGDRYTGATLLTANAAFSVMWGLGGFSGPPITGYAMDVLGPNGLPYMLFILFGVLLAVSLVKYPLRKLAS